MKIPKIPNNSLSEEITEIVSLCEQLAPEYGEDASWFLPPTSEEEIVNWENENNVSIPESYKEWLRFSSESQLRNVLAHFYNIEKIRLNSKGTRNDLVKIADLMGDGETLYFSKNSGKFVWDDHGNEEEVADFKLVLKEIIRLLRKKSSLSKSSQDLLLAMVKASKAKKNEGTN